MHFTAEAEDEIIREAVLHKVYRPLVNLSIKVWRDSTQTKSPTSPFHIGDSLIYINESHNDILNLVGVNTNDPDSIKYIFKFLRGNTMVVTKVPKVK